MENGIQVSVDQLLNIGIAARLGAIRAALIEKFGYIVQDGPFRSMVLPNEHSWGQMGDFIPKILGTYEQELQPYIEKAIKKSPGIVMNIGCAEGYYGIGLARRLPEAKVYCVDADPKARDVCSTVAGDVNGVWVPIVDSVSESTLRLLKTHSRHSLIVMDIEGAELDLLSESVCASLTNTDLIVECHDFLNPSITETLRRRLEGTHDIEIVREGWRDPASIPALEMLSSTERWLCVNEGRPGPVMKWIAAWAKGR